MIRALDQNGDWTFGKGKNDYKKDEESLVQDLQTRLLEWKNDCFFSKESGIDYKNYLDVGTKFFLDADFKRVILQTTGVLRINSLTSEIIKETRVYTATFNVLTIYGDLENSFISRGG